MTHRPGVALTLTRSALTLTAVLTPSQAGSECPALVIDYSNQRCYRLDRNTQGRTRDLQPREDYNYFEKICLGRE